MNHTINAAIQIVPKSKDKDSYALVDEAIAAIKKSGIKHLVTPMETVVEGTYEEVMQVFKAAQEASLTAGADELLVNIKLQVRKNSSVTIEDKIEKYS